ncbi:CopM family metallochaperone [Chelatococcus daeguensis]
MKISMIALALAVGMAAPAFAQQPPDAGHGAHHGAPAESGQATAPQVQMPQAQAPQAQTPAAMPGMGMMGAGQGGCPMMQGMMQGMMGRGGMGQGMGSGMAGTPRGDQSVASLAFNAVNERMHRDMDVTFTGDADADFVRAMIPHHQGAVDMAKVVLAFGKDPKIRELAESVVQAQESEIAMMKAWLEANEKK